MAYPRKTRRNRDIVRLRDKQGWTFQRIGQYYNIMRHTAYEVYTREKAKKNKAGLLSTGVRS